jgi:threonine dehydratase
MDPESVSLADIRTAQARIAPYVRHTPLLQSEWLDQQHEARLFFKCENLQEIGAFKVRGATNAVFALNAEVLRGGVVTHSSGNHGAAVARAARLRGVPARIVMPGNSAASKIAAVRRYGGEVVLCAPTLAAREAQAARLVAETAAAFIHPYDDPFVIAGQGTVGLELHESLPELDCVLCPIGGGGLASGVSVAIKALHPTVRMIGVEPKAADDAYQSFRAGRLTPAQAASGARAAPPTIADGLRAQLSERTLTLLRSHLDDIVTVSEDAIVQAMRDLWTHLHVIVEPSSSVPYAALLEGRLRVRGQRVAIILTGGNVDLDHLPWMSVSPKARGGK